MWKHWHRKSVTIGPRIWPRGVAYLHSFGVGDPLPPVDPRWYFFSYPPLLPDSSGSAPYINHTLFSSPSFLLSKMTSPPPPPPILYDLIGLGFGPANLALSGALLESDVRRILPWFAPRLLIARHTARLVIAQEHLFHRET